MTDSARRWKRIARRLRARYRQELALEHARLLATRDALRMMITELADSLARESAEIDEGWPSPGDGSEN